LIDLSFILVGILGGLVRSLYGLLKAVNLGFKVNKGYFLVTLVISGLLGGILGAVFNIDVKVAALAGYVGTDILENIFKGSMSKSIILSKR